MTDKAVRPIVIVKRTRGGGAAHHGGAWKVAYADFVTAMMAFFMVMWLIASVTKEQRAAIADYFKNPSMESGKSTRPAPGQMGPGGASTSVINLHGGLDAPRTAMSRDITLTPGTTKPVAAPTPDEARQAAAAAERKKLESLMDDLRKAIDESVALRAFKDQLLLDITPEGLRIQIVDAQSRPMFDLGSAKLKPYTIEILRMLAPYLSSVPNRLSLSGHTDTTPYIAQDGYTNWDLSADRANAARRALESGGMSAEKVARIVGLSSAVLFNRGNPRDPINRRISIIVMNKEAEESALKTDSATQVDPATLKDAKPGVVEAKPGADTAGATPLASAPPGASPAAASQ